MLLNAIHITRYSEGRWILNTPEGRNVLINEQMFQLVEILRNSSNIQEACTQFNAMYDSAVNLSEFAQFVQSRLGGYAILLNDEQPSKPYGYVKYLKLKIQLFNGRIAGWLSLIFTPLFTPLLFWLLFAFMLSISLYIVVYVYKESSISITGVDWLLLMVLVYSSMFIHELGHIAACRRFNMKHGGIGFGVYLIFPVVYADITGIWHATKQQRLIANLAGIFNEYFYAFCLLGLYFYTDNHTFLMAYIVIASKAIFELNPFVRMDGYWVLSDLTNTPNLMPRAYTALHERMGLSKIRKNPARLKDLLLIIYALANYIIVLVFAVSIWRNYQTEIISFPSDVWKLGVELVQGTLSFGEFKGHFLLMILFYYLIAAYSYALLIKPIWRKRASKSKVRVRRSKVDEEKTNSDLV